jgi:hypothetical protein
VDGKKVKLLIAALVATGAMAASGTGASAAVTTFSVNPDATIQAGGSAVVVTGLVQCTAGDSIDIGAIVLQSKGQLIGDGSGDTGVLTCTGGLQSWSVAVPAQIGSFKPGQASSLDEAFDLTDGTSATANQTLHLHK